MNEAPDRKTMVESGSGFIFGRNEDPLDPDKELRDIAASLVVNAEWRDRTQDYGGDLLVVRNIGDETFKKLRAVIPDIIDVISSIYGIESAEILGNIKNRMIKMRQSGHPDWNVLRRGDQKEFTKEQLESLYKEVLAIIEKI
ncbi:hypothetical protein HZA39_03515 [Candidatus Peregrinibacteria bacterium]|nr:hypothetical protein [Candidatus Peregrinibacteria bacterium]